MLTKSPDIHQQLNEPASRGLSATAELRVYVSGKDITQASL